MTRYISEAALKSLAEGSLEHIRYLLGESLPHLFPGKKSNILCTFPDRAVVVTEGGEFFTVTYALSPASKLRDVKAERLTLPVREMRDPKVQRANAAEVVSLLHEGDQQNAERVLSALVMSAHPRPLDEASAADAFVSAVRGKSGWKRRVEGRLPELRNFIGGMAARVEAARPRARFLGMVESSDLTPAWDGLKSRFQMLSSLARLTRIRLESISSRLSAAENADRAVAFRSLAVDFFDDLDRVHHALVDSSRAVSSPRHVARMHDALAEELQKFELVGAFCSETVRRFEEELRR